MIQDIIKIREELDGFIEVEYPYEFQKGCLIKYITHKKNLEEESFYPGGSFISYGDNYIVVYIYPPIYRLLAYIYIKGSSHNDLYWICNNNSFN